MGETSVLTPEAVREELLGRIEELEREIGHLKRRTPPPNTGPSHPTKEERLAGLEELRRFREEVLRARGGVPFPPSAPEIEKMREERVTQILDAVRGEKGT